jgi:hypothetical protein
MRVSEAKSSGLFGNGARLPAMLLESVVGFVVSIQKNAQKVSGSTRRLAVSREMMYIVKLLVDV